MSQELATGLQLNNSDDAARQHHLLQKAYQEIADSVGLVIWHYDIVNNTLEMLNRNEKHYLSSIAPEIPNHLPSGPDDFLAYLAVESREAYRQLHRQVREGRSGSCDIKFLQQPGQPPHWERIIYNIPRTEGGKPTDTYGVAMDITAEKLRAQQYNAEMRLLHTAVRSNMLAKCHFDLTDNRMLDYVQHSPNAIKMPLGITYQEFLQHISSMVISREDCALILENLAYNRLLHLCAMGNADFSIEYKRHCDDLSPIMVECTVTLFPGRNNHAECFICFYDITNKFINYIISDKIHQLGYGSVALVNNLTGTMTFFSKQTGVMENMPDRPLFYDDELYRVICKFVPDTRKAREIFQHTKLDSIIDCLDNMPEGQMYDYAFDLYDAALQQKLRKRIQACYLDSSHTSIFVIQSDITKQYQEEREQLRRLEAALTEADKANESKSMFLAGISHDMRTPLNGILSFTNFALQTDSSQQQKYYLTKIRQSGELLLSLINDTLNLTRLESGKVSVERQWLDTHAMLEELFASVTVRASEHQLTIHRHLAADVPRHVIGDKLKLQGIMLNILSNAIKFTKPGGEINFSMDIIHPQDQSQRELAMVSSTNHKWLCIVVSDNGIGMSDEFLPRLFDAFSQEDSHEVENPNGIGLGLSIVKKYVDLLEGTITVRSKAGQGTAFEIHIMVEETNCRPADISSLSRSCNFSKMKILVAEDNLLNQEIAAMLLQNKGAALDIAANGQEAVEMFEKSQPGTYQLILMDLRMPVLNGYDATKRIRKCSHPDSRTIPIIAMTADAYEEDIQRCLECGMNSHVSKPINPDMLYREITIHCSK